MDLRGSCGPSKKLKLKNCIFRHISDDLKGIWHWLISSRSVHRCGLGWSRYPGLDFWISHRLAVWWAVKCRFLRCQKILQIFTRWVLDILAHKLAWMCQYMWIYGAFFYLFFFGVPSLRYSRSSNFAKIKIVHLRHEGSMIEVQCELVICRGPFYLAKDTFWEFLPFTVLS